MIDRQFSQCLNVWWAEHLGDWFHSNYDPFGEKRYIFSTRNTSSRATFSSQRKEFIAKWDREVFRRHAKTMMDDVWERKEIRFCYTYWAPFCGSPGCGARNKEAYFFSAQWRGRGSQNHSGRCCPHPCRRNSIFLDTWGPEMTGSSPSELLIYLFQTIILKHCESRHLVQKGTNFSLTRE